MIAAVKNVAARLVRVERERPSHEPPTLDRVALEAPVTAAKERVEAANAKHRESMARVDEVRTQIRAAEQAFDSDGSEEGADAIVKLKRELERRELFSQRTQRAAIAAAGELEQATAARTAALLEHLNDRVTNAHVRLRELWHVKGHATVTRLAEFVKEADALIADAQAANAEARDLTRGAHMDAHARSMGLEGLKSVLSRWASDAVDPKVLMRLEGLFR